MEKYRSPSLSEILKQEVPFLEVQAWWGSSKHLGGQNATRELLELCKIGEQKTVLDVGCGAGATSRYMAKRYHCRVTGVDIIPRMIDIAKERAKKEGVDTLVRFEIADALNLPFPDGTFDLVIAESVLTFVEDKDGAIREFIRVTKPGGFVGINESSWLKGPPSKEVLDYVSHAFGRKARLLSPEEWRQIFGANGLQEIVVMKHEFKANISDFMQSIRQTGARYIPGVFFRVIYAFIRYSAFREYIRGSLFSIPKDTFENMGYGIYAGRKGQRSL